MASKVDILSPPPPLPPLLSADGLIGRISPTILLIIVILGAIFSISGLLHLLVRYLLRKSGRDQEYLDSTTALQGQLQQLFHLHDAGVDQSFIDTLPIFLYKNIGGAKEPFDCAVCLCEFDADSKLRLLPECSHAFHAECVDTWLLAHSTCPLCRTSLLPGFGPRSNYTPFVFLLQSGGESSGEMREEDPVTSSGSESRGKSGEVGVSPPPRFVPIKLGKLKSVEAGGEGSGSSSLALDGRRCFSMGSFEYVMEEMSMVHVSVKEQGKKPIFKNPGHRPAISDCDCSSRREAFKSFETGESLSVSKIWLRSKKEKPAAVGSSRRVFSFRLPLQEGSRGALSFRLPVQSGGAAENGKAKCGGSRRTAASEVELRWYDKSGGELGYDVEAASVGGGNIISRGGETPSFARRTLLWIAGRHHKVGSHSESGQITSSGPILITGLSGAEAKEGGIRREDP